MANSLRFIVDSITSDTEQGVLKDITEYSTPSRADVGLFVNGYKMDVDATINTSLEIQSNTNDPNTATEWSFDIPADGWFRFLIVAVPPYSSMTTFSLYDAAYSTSTKKVYRSKQNSNSGQSLSDTAWWEEIADPGTLAMNVGEPTETGNIDSLIYEPGLFPRIQRDYATQIADASEEYLTSLNIPDEDLERYSLLSVLVNGAQVRADRTQMSQCERVTRRLESIFESLSNDSRS